MAKSLIIRASAKINIGLKICGTRSDGFHEIESVMQQVSLADTLSLEQRGDTQIYFSCTDPALAGADNLVYRAAEKLVSRIAKSVPGVNIVLNKNIPVEAGLAGGSADAAAALKGLNVIWQLNLSPEELLEIGSELGSDIPFCLQGGTALARGRGELLEKLPESPFFWVVLALPPGAKVSTAAAYGGFDRTMIGQPCLDRLVLAFRDGDRETIKLWMQEEMTNTLATADLPEASAYRRLKTDLISCGLRPQLSGSGPTLFMLFDAPAEAIRASRAVEEAGARAYLCWTEKG